jgi:hypothetical protein
LPDEVEFPDLVGDLAAGNVRRRALFYWRFSATDTDGKYAALIKIDRTGAGQLPRSDDKLEDFRQYEEDPNPKAPAAKDGA